MCEERRQMERKTIKMITLEKVEAAQCLPQSQLLLFHTTVSV